MKKILALLSLGFAVASFTGCVSYTGITGTTDDQVDEANRSYVAAAQKAYEARMKAPPRPVVVTEAPGMALFLGPNAMANHPICQDLAVRKEVALMFKSQLRERVGAIKDFKLVDENAPLISVTAETDAAAAPQNYRITYNITSLELRENASGSLTTGLIGAGVGGVAGQQVANQKFWDGIAKVEVRLFKPNGTDCVFSFSGEGKYTKMVDANTPVSKDLLVEAVKIAAKNAMEGYSTKFGPQTYVTDTCQDGRFARLNIGRNFNVQAGQNVEFYRNKVRKGPSGEDEVARQVVGRGIVGEKEAPIEEDCAWVFVEDYDEKARKVFTWTSARILPAVKK